MKPRILLFYPDSKNGEGHHGHWHDLIFNVLNDLGDVFLIDSYEKIPVVKSGAIKWCVDFSGKNNFDLVFIPWLDAHRMEIYKNPRLKPKDVSFVAIWMNPMPFKFSMIREKNHLRKILY